MDHTWSAATRPPARFAKPARNYSRRAVEKAGPWRPWKTTNRFPTVPTVPWKSRNSGGIPTFPPLRRFLFYEKRPANPLRPAEEARRARQAKADRSRVNKTEQIDKLRTEVINVSVACQLPFL